MRANFSRRTVALASSAAFTSRKSPLPLWYAIAALGALALPTPQASTSPGQTLAAELRSLRPTDNVEVRGQIRRRNAEGRRTVIPFVYRTRLNADTWETTYETPGDHAIPAQKLTVTHADGAPTRYQLESPGAATNEPPRVLHGEAAMIPFAESDFWLADLGLEYFHWPEHRIVEEAKIRMRKGRPCKVLESTNPHAGARGYSRVVSWIDNETGKPILAEAYGPDRKLLKEFEIGGVTKVQGAWQLKNMEMRDVTADSLTILEFQYEHRE